MATSVGHRSPKCIVKFRVISWSNYFYFLNFLTVAQYNAHFRLPSNFTKELRIGSKRWKVRACHFLNFRSSSEIINPLERNNLSEPQYCSCEKKEEVILYFQCTFGILRFRGLLLDAQMPFASWYLLFSK